MNFTREENLQLAMAAVGVGMSKKAAAARYGIPRTTLRDKLAGRTPIHPKRRNALTTAEEQKFVNWLLLLSQTGFGRTTDDLQNGVQKYLNSCNRVTTFKDNRPSKEWAYLFLNRHQELLKKQPQILVKDQHDLVTHNNQIECWFQNFQEFIMSQDPTILQDPSRIFNADENGFDLGPKGLKVVGPKSRVQKYLPNATSTIKLKEQITTLFCISAAGQYLPPLVVMPGKPNRLQDDFQINFPGAVLGFTEDGWMDVELFTSFLEKILIPNTKHLKKPILLLVDSSATHKSYESTKICMENEIILYCLPENSIHLTHPCDVSFFGTLKKNWEEAALKFKSEHSGKSVTKHSFVKVLKTAFDGSVSPSLAQTSFEKSGLYPFDPSAFLQSTELTQSLDLHTPSSTDVPPQVTPKPSPKIPSKSLPKTPKISKKTTTAQSLASPSPSLPKASKISNETTTTQSLVSPSPSLPETSKISNETSTTQSLVSPSPSLPKTSKISNETSTTQISANPSTSLPKTSKISKETTTTQSSAISSPSLPKTSKISKETTITQSLASPSTSLPKASKISKETITTQSLVNTSPSLPKASKISKETTTTQSLASPSTSFKYTPSDCLNIVEHFLPAGHLEKFHDRQKKGHNPKNDTLYVFWSQLKSGLMDESEMSTTQQPEAQQATQVSIPLASAASNSNPVHECDEILTSPETVHTTSRKTSEKLPKELPSDEAKLCFEEKEKKKKKEEKRARKQARKEKRAAKKARADEERQMKMKEREEKERKQGEIETIIFLGGRKRRHELLEESSDEEMNMMCDGDSDNSLELGLNVDVNKCHSCGTKYMDEEPKSWVGCDNCQRKFHKKCVEDMDLSELSEEDLKGFEFLCDYCL